VESSAPLPPLGLPGRQTKRQKRAENRRTTTLTLWIFFLPTHQGGPCVLHAAVRTLAPQKCGRLPTSLRLPSTSSLLPLLCPSLSFSLSHPLQSPAPVNFAIKLWYFFRTQTFCQSVPLRNATTLVHGAPLQSILVSYDRPVRHYQPGCPRAQSC
jgi:hypothetical protein